MSRLEAARLPVTVGLIVGLLGLVVSVGADAGWLAALGHVIAETGSVPVGVPFAAAPTAGWSNPLALAELSFWGLVDGIGHTGLIAAQLLAVAAGLGLVARDAIAGGARSQVVAGVLLLIALGSLQSFALARVQLFSLVLFPALVMLLRAEARHPSRRVWLVLPLLALWANLHGAVLSALPVLYAYLVLARARADRWTALGVALAVPVALCLTPAGIDTIGYYHGLVTNLAATRGSGQWGPLGASPLDWPLVAVAIALVVRLRHRWPDRWETVVLVLFAALTVKAARNGVWLLFLLAPPAACAGRPGRSWTGLVPIGGVLAVALLVLDAGHWSATGWSGDRAARRAIALAHGTPVLADGLLAEQVALDGGRIWAGNPLDAFSHRVQGRYLDWLDGNRRGRAALTIPEVQVVLVHGGSAAGRLTAADPAYAPAGRVGSDLLFVRRA